MVEAEIFGYFCESNIIEIFGVSTDAFFAVSDGEDGWTFILIDTDLWSIETLLRSFYNDLVGALHVKGIDRFVIL